MKIGSIVNIKNICFKDGKIDHSFKSGRPCIFLGELEDNMCFMPLTNTKTLKHHVKTIIKPSELNGLKKVSHPNLKELIEKPIAYYEELGCITEKEIINVFNGIKGYYKEIRIPSDEKLLALANNYLNQTDLNYVDEDIIKSRAKNT